MKHILKHFACLFVAILCFGQVWAATTLVPVSASDLVNGDYLITATKSDSEYMLPAGTFAKGKATAAALTSENYSKVWTFTKSGNTWNVTLSTGEGLGVTATNNGVICASNAGTAFTISETAANATTVYMIASDGSDDRNLTLYKTDDWRCYKTTTNANADQVRAIQLYKVVESSTTVSVTGVTLNKSELELEVDESETLTATVAPNNATNKNVSWESSNTAVATVTNGAVTAVAEGSATITVTTEDGSFTDECEVTVTAASSAVKYVKFTGGIEEGDYVIYYDGKAMKNTVASNRLSYEEVTPANDKIKNPAETIVWHIAPAATEGYWTVYNAAVSKYMVCTGSNNQANLNASAENAIVSVEEVSEGNYNILSKVRKDAGSNNYFLRENTTYGFAFYSSTTGGTLTLYKNASAAPTVTAPTISGDENFVASATVTITQTNADAIYYTTNGDAPTTSSTPYTAPFSLTNTATVKAIAVKGNDVSEVASKDFTKVEALTTMDAIFAAATAAGSTATDVYVTFNNWVVTGVKNSNAYVTDGTKGFIIYASGHGFAVGNILSGTVACKVQLYNGAAELTNLTSSTTGITVTTGGTASVNVLDATGIGNLSGVNTGSLIKISGECAYESSKYYIADVQLYNQLYSFSVSAGTNYECTGVYVLNTTYGNEILPRSAADIVAQTSVANPTFSPAAGEYTEVQNVTLSCATDGATVYYTTDGTNPTNESTVYSSAIEVGASMTIKAIAYKGEDHSEVVSATYTINLPIPSHDFQITHNFTTGEGFEFPTGWGGSYAEHEIAYTDDKVHFVSASHQSGTITDRPVVKEGAISLILTNSTKLISAVRFDYSQWSTKVPTLTMKYSTDGGETYSNFNPVVSTTNFALQVLDMPEGVNAIQVVGTADKQVGLTSIAFDLVNKPVVTKTVTITTPSNGTLVVKNGDDAIASGDAIEVGSVLTITATPADGYILAGVTVNGSAYAASTLTLTENVTIAASFEENQAELVNSYVLSEIGTETSHLVSGQRVGDKVTLPSTAATCSKTFVGWDKSSTCAVAPEYAPGAEYTLALNNQLYAVYADESAGSTWNVATSVAAGDVVVISTNTGYTANPMKTAGTISSSIFSATASTYGSENAQITELAEGTMEFTVGGNATDGWTLKNGTKYLKVTAAKKVGLVDDAETWTISFSGNNVTLAPKTGDYTGYSIQYNYNTGNDRFTAYNTTQVAISLYKQAVSYNNYSTDCEAVTPPTPPAGSDNVVILATYSGKLYAMSTTLSSSAFTAIEVEEDGSNIVVPSAEAKTAIQWTKKTSGDNTTFQDANGKYLAHTGTGTNLMLQEADAENPEVWTLHEDGYYYAVSGRTFFYYKDGIFKNYSVNNAGGDNYSGYAEVRVIAGNNIIVTSKANPDLAYTPASVELIVGGTFTPATLTYAQGFDGLAAITYESSNTDLATVEGGVVSLVADAVGTATITATFAGNNNYLAGSASYTITVNEPGDDLSGTWTLASAVAAGDQIIIGATKDAKTYAMGKQNSNNRAAVASELNGTTLTPGAATKVFTLVDAGDSKFAIKTSDNKYLTSATSGTSNNLLEAANYENDNAKWSISIDGDGVASIVAAAGSKTVMQYNGGSTIFSCYGSASQTNVNIYKKESATPPTADYTRTVTAGRYGTICLPNGGTISGAKLYDLEYFDGSYLYFLEVNGNAMVAGRPYVFLPSATTIEVTYTDDANADAGSYNGLIGSYTQETVDADDGNYILYNNKYCFVNSLASVGANRAYIHMDDVPTEPSTPQQGDAPRRRISMGVQGEQVATGILDIETGEQPMKVMMDGKLYIIRAGQLYDMTGRKVK